MMKYLFLILFPLTTFSCVVKENLSLDETRMLINTLTERQCEHDVFIIKSKQEYYQFLAEFEQSTNGKSMPILAINFELNNVAIICKNANYNPELKKIEKRNKDYIMIFSETKFPKASHLNQVIVMSIPKYINQLSIKN